MNNSSGSISLKCTGCGSSLDITSDLEVFACGYCGARQLVRRSGGTISLKPLEEGIARVQEGTDRTAAELAVRRLREDLAVVDSDIERARTDFAKQNGATQGGLLLVLFGGAGLAALFVMFNQITLCFIAFGAALLIPGLLSRSLLDGARKKLMDREQPLTAKRTQIDAELQKHLVLLNQPNG